MRTNGNSPRREHRLLLGLAIVLVPFSAFSFSDKKPFDISADALEYIEDSDVLIAEGRVVVTQDSSTLKADYLLFDRKARRLTGRGNVFLREGDKIVSGSTMDYDLAAEKGTFEQPKAFATPWLFQGGSWEKQQDSYLGRNGGFTSCDLADPHYIFRARRIRYVPNDRFWAWNTWALADGIPVFYMPFSQKPLGPQVLVFQADPGSDSANGNFARTVTTARYAPRIYQKFHVDYYGDVGTGLGTELNYQPSDRMKGSFFGYYINPHTAPDVAGATAETQYNVRSFHWQRLSEALTLQSNVNLRKNVSFNNLFYRQDTNQAVNEIISSLALTHQTKRASQRVLLEANQAPDPGADPLFGQTHVQSASMPRYEFTVYQFPLWKPRTTLPAGTTAQRGSVSAPSKIGSVNFDVTGSAGESYLRADRENRTAAQTLMNVSQSYTLTRDWSLSQGLRADTRWRDRANPGVVGDTGAFGENQGVQNVFGWNANLRRRLGRAFTLDSGYSLGVRTVPDGLSLDQSRNDKGIETSKIAFGLNGRPTRDLLVRSFSGFDLRSLDNESPTSYRQRRVDPWTSDATWTPRKLPFESYARYELAHYPTRVNSWEASGRYKGIYRTIVDSALLYTRGTPGQLTWNNRLGFFFSPGWRVDSVLNGVVPAPGTGSSVRGKFQSTEFSVIRDLHCWELRFRALDRPPITREYSFTANLRFGGRRAKTIADEKWESQFYPWRADAQPN